MADTLIRKGVKFISFRNEQAASYAASVYGYLTGRPGVLLVVGGPGIVHGLAGIYNASSNRWPMVVIAGSASNSERYRGGFQELDQVSFLQPHVKFAAKPHNVSKVPFLLEKAFRVSASGVPGPSYVDLPADIIEGESHEVSLSVEYHTPIKSLADPRQIDLAAAILKSAKCPLVIIGKGCAFADASGEIIKLVDRHKLPFLPTPMGKGVVSDNSPLNVSSARSAALQSADVVLLLGARLNWMLHNGDRFRSGVKVIQVDSCAEEIGNNDSGSYIYGLLGDMKLTVGALSSVLDDFQAPPIDSSLTKAMEKNSLKLLEREKITDTALPSYHQVYRVVRETLSILEKVIYVSEGANSMDVARVSFPMTQPKQRLDAGTNATMGVGLAYAIAAKVSRPDHLVLTIEGDSAFGFSAMELETCVRSKLPIIVLVMNNSGVYHGVGPGAYDKTLPSTALSHNTRYDLLAKSLGGEGISVDRLGDLENALHTALTWYGEGKTVVLNVIIDPGTEKKLEFAWQNKSKL